MRILVVGTSCAGKSTFARALAAKNGVPLIELDELYWAANWQPRELAEFRGRVARATASDRWVADGNYGSVRDVLWPRASVVVWLNYGFPTVFWRALRRTIRRSITREALWSGNRESWRRSFLSRESILWWVITTHRRRSKDFARLRQDNVYPSLEWIEFRQPAEAERYLRTLAAAQYSDR